MPHDAHRWSQLVHGQYLQNSGQESLNTPSWLVCSPHNSLQEKDFYHSLFPPREKPRVYPTLPCWVAQSCLTLHDPRDCSPPGSSVHGDSPGESTRVGCHSLCQAIFPTQGLNPGLSHYRRILYHLRHQGSPCSTLESFILSVSLKGRGHIKKQLGWGGSPPSETSSVKKQDLIKDYGGLPRWC